MAAPFLTRRFPLALALLTGPVAGCGGSATIAPVSPPLGNLVVTVVPGLSASFSQQGGIHVLTAGFADTLGNPLPGRTVTWSLVPSSSFVTVNSGGIVTVSVLAPPGDYSIQATAGGVAGTATVRVLPRPPGKLIFVASLNGSAQLFRKDFNNEDDPVQLSSGSGPIEGMAVDPATTTIFFARGTPPNIDIYRIQLDGAALLNLTHDPASTNQDPAVHPTTHQIYFSRRAGGVAQIFRMEPDGTGLTQVTTGPQSKGAPAISPDGSRLAWTELFPPGADPELVTAPISGLDPVRFTDRVGGDATPFWLSNGRLLWAASAASNPEIFGADAPGGGNLRNFTNAPAGDSQPGPACLPDSFTFLSDRDGPSTAYHYELAGGLIVQYRLRGNHTLTLSQRLCD